MRTEPFRYRSRPFALWDDAANEATNAALVRSAIEESAAEALILDEATFAACVEDVIAHRHDDGLEFADDGAMRILQRAAEEFLVQFMEVSVSASVSAIVLR